MKEVLFCVARLPLLVSLMAASLAHGGSPPLAHLEECDNTTCFLLFREALDFGAAGDACRAEAGGLATLQSAAEEQRVQKLLLRASGERFWIGLTLAPSHGRCPSNDSAGYGYKWLTGAAAVNSSRWTRVPDKCDHGCVSASKDGAWQQEPCGGTLDGFLCSAPSGRCRVADRLAEPGEHAVSSGSTDARRSPPGADWVTRGEKGSRLVDSKWLCGFGSWWRAPWSCEVMTGGCSHTCVNSICTCPDGLALHANNISCVDALECTRDVDCTGEHTRCLERTEGGGFECACVDGYAMEDGACVDVRICDRCEHMRCPTVGGVKVCACRPGFVVSPEDATRCDLHCAGPRCPAQCVAGPEGGHPQCRCPSGFIVEDYNHPAPVCVDYSYTPTPTTAPGEGPGTPPPALPATGVPGYVRVGAALGIAVFVAAAVAALLLLLRSALRRGSGTLELVSDAGSLTLQQVTAEKYQRFSFDKQSCGETPRW